MADFSVEQKKIIDTYRFNNGLSSVLSYEAIVSIMEEKGDSETLERLNKAKDGSVFGFGFDSNLSIGDNAVFSATKKEKSNNEYNYQEQQEAANFIKSYVLDSSSEALNTLISYKKSIGSFSPGAIWHGLKNLANYLTHENQLGSITWIMNLFRENKQTNNITTLNEMQAFLKNQYKIAQSLNTIDTKQLGAIEFFYEKEMGIKFDVGKILDFKQKSENYLKVMKYKTKYDALEQGLQKVKEAYDIEKRMKIYPNIPAPEKSFDEIFVETIDEFCEGNEELKTKYIEIASQGCTNMDELRPKFIENLETLKASMQQEYNNILSGKTAEQYQKEYEQAYQDIAGENNTKEITESWIQNQMRGTGAVQMGLVIASTIMLGGSNLVASSATKLAPLVGETATGLIVKTGLTLSGTAINTGIEYANALTSETGLTQERNTQILSGAIHSLPYAFFGAFASGPIGDNLVKILCSKIPTVLPEVISKSLAASAKVAGFTTEISLDTLFEMLISDGDMQAALEGNITGEAEGRLINTLSSFITGGRVHGITQQVMKNIELEDCKIKITVDEKGNKIYQTVINGKESEPMAETDFIKLFTPEEVKGNDDITDPKSLKDKTEDVTESIETRPNTELEARGTTPQYNDNEIQAKIDKLKELNYDKDIINHALRLLEELKTASSKDFDHIEKEIQDLPSECVQLLEEVLYNTRMDCCKNIKLEYDDILTQYHKKKVEGVEKYDRPIRFVHNWNDSYGVTDANGVFRNAINELAKPDGQLDCYLKTILPNANKETFSHARELLIKYLEDNLDIYTIPRIEGILQKFSNIINKMGENTILYVPDQTKSYGLIAAMYQKMNPKTQVIVGYSNLKFYTQRFPNLKVIMIDDCIGSGESAVKSYNGIKEACPSIASVDLFVCTAFQQGLDRIKKEAGGLKIHYDGKPRRTLEESDFYKSLAMSIDGKQYDIQQRFLKAILKYNDSPKEYRTGSAIMFPYMAPNNNTIFSANMIEGLFTGPNVAIKNIEKCLTNKPGKLSWPPEWLTKKLNID